MPVSLQFTLDKRELTALAALPKRARTAAAIALTKTAKDSQAALRAEAPGVFHLRNSWVVQGIRIDGANASSLSARVGSIDKYMGRHVFGDDKPAGHALSIRKTRDANGRLASGGLLIAPYAGIGSAGTHTATRRKLGRVDGQKRKTFQILGKGGSKVLIVRRTSRKRNPLQVLAILENYAHDHRIWRMDHTVSTVVGARFGAHFEAAIGAMK